MVRGELSLVSGARADPYPSRQMAATRFRFAAEVVRRDGGGRHAIVRALRGVRRGCGSLAASITIRCSIDRSW